MSQEWAEAGANDVRLDSPVSTGVDLRPVGFRHLAATKAICECLVDDAYRFRSVSALGVRDAIR